MSGTLTRLMQAIDRRLARRYAPHIQCPDCGEHVPVDHALTITTDPTGAQELVSEPDLGPLWAHWGTHLGLKGGGA